MRGEKEEPAPKPISDLGSPPRARGKARDSQAHHAGRGITPACAGKSRLSPKRETLWGDHPRVRGEKSRPFWAPVAMRGSPPRARGKDAGDIRPRRTPGITPACAGKRGIYLFIAYLKGDHPRVRGEKAIGQQGFSSLEGSPPRARGKGTAKTSACRLVGITPACAGKSTIAFSRLARCRDHPRVRGEKGLIMIDGQEGIGSPPRARGKATAGSGSSSTYGITPACAGKRSVSASRRSCRWDHPRVRGEKDTPF